MKSRTFGFTRLSMRFLGQPSGEYWGASAASVAKALAATAFVLLAAGASAQEFSVGQIRMHQPFATPTPPGAKVGAAYFSHLENRGTEPDKLLRASSPASARVELHVGEIGSDGVMRMRELDDLPLPPGANLEMKPGGGSHLMLMDLKKPLAQGDSFPLTLEFERAGKVEVNVIVQTPKPGSGHGHGSTHNKH